MRTWPRIYALSGLLLTSLFLYAQPNITRVEYFIDTDPGLGNGTAIPASESPVVDINTTLDLSHITDGFHWIYLRGKDAEGRWSVASCRMFYKGILETPGPTDPEIVTAEYFFDSDPGFGNGIPLSITSGTDVSINQDIDVGSLTDGFHWVYIRAMDSRGKWSVASARLFTKGDLSGIAPEIKNVKRLEYFFNTDPGLGNGTPIPITEGTEVSINHLIDVSSCSDGINRLYLRGVDENGRWSVSSVRVFYKGQYHEAPENANIKRVEYFIDTDPGFGLATSLPFTQDSEVEITSIIDLGSLSEGDHTFAVRVQDSFGRWSYLFTRNFYLDSTPPSAPTGLEAIIGNSEVTLKWDKNSEDDFLRYKIYVGLSAGNELLTDSTSGTISDTVRVITGLTNDINYSFFVTAVDSTLLESSPGNRVNATPLASAGPPPAPAVNSASQLNQYSFRANWSPSPSAEGYNLDVSTNTNFTSFVTGYNNKDIGNVTGFEVTGLNLNTTYYYRLRAYSSYGTSHNSGTVSVTTLLDPPELPSIPVATDATLISQTEFTANWNMASAVTGYQIDVATDISFESILPDYDNKDVGNDTIISVTGLTKETEYHYRIRAYNSYGSSSNSNTVSVITLPDPPPAPIANPSTGISQTAFTANWEFSEGASGYLIDVATDNGFTSYLSGYQEKDVSNTNSYTISGLLPNVTYYLRIRAYNTGGVSASSNIISTITEDGLSTPPDPPSVLDASDISQTTFTANWNSSSNATGYKLDVSTDISFNTIVTDFNNRDVGNVTSIQVTGLVANTAYYYRIRAYNAGGTSNNSGVLSLTTLPYQPAKPTGLIATSCYDLVTIKWNKNLDTDFLQYRVYGGTSPEVLEELEITSSGNRDDTTRVYENVVRGTRYYYRVTAMNSIGLESDSSDLTSVVANWGVIPKIHIKWNDVLICYNIGDSLSAFQWYKGNDPIPGATNQYYVSKKQPGDYSVVTVDENGCSDRSAVINVASSVSLTAYPNPSNDLLSLSYESEQTGRVHISILSGNGVIMKEINTEKPDYYFNMEISVKDLHAGAYTLEIKVGNGSPERTRILIIK